MLVAAQPGGRLLANLTASRPRQTMQLAHKQANPGTRGVQQGLYCAAVRPSSSGRLNGQRRRKPQPAQAPPEVQPLPHASCPLHCGRPWLRPSCLPVLRVSDKSTASIWSCLHGYRCPLAVDLPAFCVDANKVGTPTQEVRSAERHRVRDDTDIAREGAARRAARAQDTTSTKSSVSERRRDRVSTMQAAIMADRDASRNGNHIAEAKGQERRQPGTVPVSANGRTAAPNLAQQAPTQPEQRQPPSRLELTAAVANLQVSFWLTAVPYHARPPCTLLQQMQLLAVVNLRRRGCWQACGLRKRKAKQQDATCTIGLHR